jgi:hypothetical protein
LTDSRPKAVGQALDGRALGHGYRICTATLALLSNVADPSLILDISIHMPEHYGKEDLKHGDHSRIKETTPLNVVETLEEEFKTQRGQIMVSRKSRLQS